MKLSLKNNLETIKKAEPFFERFAVIFVALQAIIDLLTTFTVKVLQIDISFAMLVRFAFLGISVIYVLLYAKKGLKVICSLLIMLFAGHLISALIFERTLFFENARFYLRTAVFPFALMMYYSIFDKSDSDKRRELIRRIAFSFEFVLVIICVVCIISTLTETNMKMYEDGDGRFGSQGWFLSGNELASTVIILSGIPLYCFMQKRSWKTLAVILLQVATICLLGTKSSVFVLLAVLAMIVYAVIYLLIQKKLKLLKAAVLVIAVAVVASMWSVLPVTNNLKIQAALQQKINSESSQREGGEVLPYIQEKHDKAVAVNDGSFIAGINMQLGYDSAVIEGYFYPCYADIGHPSFIEKTLAVKDETGAVRYIDLEDSYNRNVPNPKEGEYSSLFSGLRAEFNPVDYFKEDREYKLSIIIKVDGFEAEYNIDEVIFVRDAGFGNEHIYENGVLKIGKAVEVDEDEINSFESYFEKVKYSMWFSARDARLKQVINSFDFTGLKVLFGGGYVGNYDTVNSVKGLELDFVEIFITFGLFGGALYFGLYFYLAFKGGIVRTFKRKFKGVLSPEFILFAIPIVLSAGAAFIAGHTFLTPSVAIDVAVMTAGFSFSEANFSKEEIKA